MERHTNSESTMNRELVLAELQRILESEAFLRSKRMQRFLTFVVEETLGGRADQLGEYSLGVSVFDRGTDFEPALDPIVRNDARRLRFKLHEYYRQPQLDGCANHGIRIDIPKGAYVAVFVPVTLRPQVLAAPVGRRLTVLPFETLSHSKEDSFCSQGLHLSLTAALTGLDGVEAVASGYAKERKPGELAAELGLSHFVQGTILRSEDRYRVFVTLVRATDGAQLWALTQDFDASRTFSAQTEIADVVAREVLSRLNVRKTERPRLALAA